MSPSAGNHLYASIQRRIRRGWESYYARQVRNGSPRVVFVLSHMRSGSSLLSHILVSHPEIRGYGEAHVAYRSGRDLGRLIYRVTRSFGERRITAPYVFDKLLHGQLLPDEAVLHSANLKCVFLLRSPRSSLPSLLEVEPERTEEGALEYYTERLSTLERYAELLPRGEAYFLTYRHLRRRTPESLAGLTSFLGLRTPLREDYELNWATGRGGIGDPSERIRAGRILRDCRAYQAQVSAETMDAALAAFRHTRRVLLDRCRSLAGAPVLPSADRANSHTLEAHEHSDPGDGFAPIRNDVGRSDARDGARRGVHPRAVQPGP